MRRVRLAFILLLVGGAGCRSLGEAAARAVLVTAARLVTAGVCQAVGEELVAANRPVSDVRSRVRCSYGRTYKLRCPENYACFYEDSEGRAYRCLTAACEEPPEGLLDWCR